jgi:hypothetical protein
VAAPASRRSPVPRSRALWTVPPPVSVALAAIRQTLVGMETDGERIKDRILRRPEEDAGSGKTGSTRGGDRVWDDGWVTRAASVARTFDEKDRIK